MNWLTYLKPQIVSHLRDLCFSGYYADDVQTILEDENWMNDECFKYRVYHYEKAEWTLQGLCDTYALLTGDMYGGEALRGTLKYNILELVRAEEFQRPIEVEYKEEVA